MARILIIDDDGSLAELLGRHLGKMGHEVDYAGTIADGQALAAYKSYDVVYLDVGLPDGSGLVLLPKIKEVSNPPEVIIFTGKGDPDGAELAITSGAWDYIQKPPSLEQLTLPLLRALEYRKEKAIQSRAALKVDGIIGSSPKMKSCLDLLAQASNTDMPTLIFGETGTGKELFAKAIHDNSPRASGPFVVVDCAALADNLVESTLFGHERGAFTGADKASPGLIRQANKGTLFLDEVGELPLSLQKPFLRVLQEHRFRPLGGRTEVESDFRLVAATNKNLEAMVEAGEYRQDLLFRIKGHVIHLPPLRERGEDIREISMGIIVRLCERYGKPTKGVSADFFRALSLYPWPGNVRELITTLERALADAMDEPTLHPNHLPVALRVKLAQSGLRPEAGPAQGAPPAPPCALNGDELPVLKDYREAILAEAEAKYIRDLLAKTDGNIKDACRISGLSRSRLYHLIQKHEIRQS
ncbi:MAG: sigma-54 dependent transcriptional regulator [Thermodesulfobacteriota bacterium]